jgi:hypothetical protein
MEPTLFTTVAQIRSFPPTESASRKLQLLGAMAFIAAGALFASARNPGWLSSLRRKFSSAAARCSAVLDRATNTFLDPTKRFYSRPWTSRFNRVDAASVIAFSALAILFLIVRWNMSYPVILLEGDAGNLASFAAAYDEPELFENDFLLSDLSNIDIYTTVHIPLIRFFHIFTSDYAKAFTLLLPPTVFLQLLGFYLLGRELLQSRYWAILFTVVAALPVNINLGESWGLRWDSLPRTLFQALVPFLLFSLMKWQKAPRRWPLLVLGMGMLVYIHPVSTPAWSAALFLSLIFLLPRSWSTRRKFAWMAILLLIWTASILPFVARYLSTRGGSPENYQAVLDIIEHYFPANLLFVPKAIQIFAKKLGLIVPISFAAWILLYFMLRKDSRTLKLTGCWLAGVLVVSVVFPYVEHLVVRYLRILPFETEFVRGVRYLIPMMSLSLLWVLREAGRRIRLPRGESFSGVIGGLALALVLVITPAFKAEFGRSMRCFLSGSLICNVSDDYTEIIGYLRETTQPGDSVLTNLSIDAEKSFALPIRYDSLRSLAFSFKDRGLLAYTNEEKLLLWERLYSRLSRVHFGRDEVASYQEYSSIADKLGAALILIEYRIPNEVLLGSGDELVFENDSYFLYRHHIR